MLKRKERHGPYVVTHGNGYKSPVLKDDHAMAEYVKAHPSEYLLITDTKTGEWHTENEAAKP